MFNVKTPKRIYYLVAETEADMNKWVDAVCQVCGLKAYTQDEEQQLFQYESQESPPTSPTSTISGPYIPISECISGRRLGDTISLDSTHGPGPDHYDAPRRLAPSPPRSPTTTDAESTFTDDEWGVPVPSVNRDTLPSDYLRSPDNSRPPDNSRLPDDLRPLEENAIDSSKPPVDAPSTRPHPSMPPAVEESIPPRPPKPPHMLHENPGHNYLNLDGATESSKPTTPATPTPMTPATTSSATVTDESYDFPRSHQPPQTIANQSVVVDQSSKHLYSNAAPSTIDDNAHVFRYDFHEDEPPSPRSESSTTATYSNLPSPLVRDGTSVVPTAMAPPPPIVYRELKPGRKTSDSTSIISNEPSPGPTIAVCEISSSEHSPAEPPSINRKLKPPLNRSPVEGPLQLASPPGRGRMRAAPSPTPPSHEHSIRHQSTSDDDNSDSEEQLKVQYLDLDLETKDFIPPITLPSTQSPPNTTVYKTVDFVKTEAFNRTRQLVEEKRKLRSDELA